MDQLESSHLSQSQIRLPSTLMEPTLPELIQLHISDADVSTSNQPENREMSKCTWDKMSSASSSSTTQVDKNMSKKNSIKSSHDYIHMKPITL
jgi:hypothetical protein